MSLFPVRVHRSRVFESLYDQYMDTGDDSPFDLVLPPTPPALVEPFPPELRLLAVPVRVVTERMGLPLELQLVVTAFYRATRVEALAVHMLFMLDSARVEEVFWLDRQRDQLRRLQGWM